MSARAGLYAAHRGGSSPTACTSGLGHPSGKLRRCRQALSYVHLLWVLAVLRLNRLAAPLLAVRLLRHRLRKQSRRREGVSEPSCIVPLTPGCAVPRLSQASESRLQRHEQYV